jgi:hypothetical protein
MDLKASSSTPPAASATTPRRKRRNGNFDAAGVRFFLPKPGSSSATPELGQELASEGEALIQAFRSGQTFYTLTAWKAVPEVNGGGSPVIVKQAVTPRQVQS